MIINDLPTIPSTITTGDEIPVERGTATYKIDYDALATAIISKLGGNPVTVAHGGTGGTNGVTARNNLSVPSRIMLLESSPTWASVYAVLNAMTAHETATVEINNTTASLLTGGKYTNVAKGVVNRPTAGGYYDFMCMNGGATSIITWRISNLTATGANVDWVYQYTGTQL